MQDRPQRPWFKKKRFVIPLALLALFVVIGVFSQPQGAQVTEAAAPAVTATQEPTQGADPEPAPQPTQEPTAEPELAVPAEHAAALEKAQMYSDTMHFSKAGLHHQLTADYGEGFPKAAADYAVEHVDADWRANALEKARMYRETMSMSNASIREQLVSDAGEKFTKAEADYAVANLDK